MVTYEELDQTELDAKKKLGELIKLKRGKMSAYRLSRIAKVSQMTILRVERGMGCNWGAAARICRALNLTIMIL